MSATMLLLFQYWLDPSPLVKPCLMLYLLLFLLSETKVAPLGVVLPNVHWDKSDSYIQKIITDLPNFIST